ncbi:FAD:protein FMN transferase [Nocardioides sp. GY 10113]|uniref:FAD:protein FMN transferase n=1 Tax=Nocardioides sp. GY 10113 TaxID=2569761 RepID=UPI0010A76E24|nr:FAD:protein FMN transferase [Nocardioides sp. GY 10113]TIC80439.1 FAD:protein FMN transferase [Nocardioides sp. GY 10113]
MSDVSATFRALGTSVFVAVRDPGELARARHLAAQVLADVDATCSRFRSDSDLSRVNAHPGEWVEVDPLLVAAVEVAVAAARATEGLVHPLLGRRLVELGYDRDFGTLVEVGDREGVESDPPELLAWARIGLDPTGALRIPPGTALDLGATGKAWAADLIGSAYDEHLRASAAVSVGGDLRIARPDGRGWQVAISERPDAPPEALVDLDRGGLATSSTRVRRWTRAGARHHHVLDPRTGHPAREVWRTVTATGATCSAANTASTASIVLGGEAPSWLADHGVTARLVARDGAVRTVGSWPVDAIGGAA